jgi:hypothetical protein
MQLNVLAGRIRTYPPNQKGEPMMKNRGGTIIILSLVLLSVGTSKSVKAQEICDVSSSQECAGASKVGADVQAALRAANLTGLSGLTLKKAVLTLETGSSITGGININFLIFTIKHQTKKTGTISQEITWGSLPKANAPPATLASITEVLARAIATSASLTASTSTLPLTEATITIKFVVDKDSGGSLSYKIMGVNLGPSVDLDKTSTNTLAVTFSK